MKDIILIIWSGLFFCSPFRTDLAVVKDDISLVFTGSIITILSASDYDITLCFSINITFLVCLMIKTTANN